MFVIVVRSLPVRAGDLLVAQVHFACAAVQRLRRLHRIQVFALDVLDERDFEDAVVRIILNDGGHFRKTSHFGRTEAPLTCDQLIVEPRAAEPIAAGLSHVFL